MGNFIILQVWNDCLLPSLHSFKSSWVLMLPPGTQEYWALANIPSVEVQTSQSLAFPAFLLSAHMQLCAEQKRPPIQAGSVLWVHGLVMGQYSCWLFNGFSHHDKLVAKLISKHLSLMTEAFRDVVLTLCFLYYNPLIPSTAPLCQPDHSAHCCLETPCAFLPLHLCSPYFTFVESVPLHTCSVETSALLRPSFSSASPLKHSLTIQCSLTSSPHKIP